MLYNMNGISLSQCDLNNSLYVLQEGGRKEIRQFIRHVLVRKPQKQTCMLDMTCFQILIYEKLR